MGDRKEYYGYDEEENHQKSRALEWCDAAGLNYEQLSEEMDDENIEAFAIAMLKDD